ncbi:MAG: hypothetical protein DRP01_00025 [Archaeoglobales archaeon]|nr:MAG: hypothetical protein DRP01_00025 [Archaeoglobales archaeon]
MINVLEDDTLTETQFGFNWGPAIVERCVSDKGSVTLRVMTKKQCLEVRVTPKGLIRVGTPTRIENKRG